MSHRHGQSPWTMAVVVDSFHWLLCTAEIINILQLEKGIAHSLMCRYIHRHKLYLVNLNLLLSSWGATTLPRTYFRHEFPSTLTFSSITQVCNRGLLYFRHEFPSINSLTFSLIYLLKSTQYSHKLSSIRQFLIPPRHSKPATTTMSNTSQINTSAQHQGDELQRVSSSQQANIGTIIMVPTFCPVTDKQ